jgi:predicted transcriptional regulator
MSEASAKEAVRQVLEKLPDDVTMEEVMYHLYVREKIQHGLEDAASGRTLPEEEVEKRMERWLKSDMTTD